MSKLKIVSWNCYCGFDGTKQKAIVEACRDADVFVIQECYYSDSVLFAEANKFSYHEWYGDGKDSCLGIGVFSKTHEVKLHPDFDYRNKFRYVVPFSLVVDGKEVVLFAVWTKGAIDGDKTHHYLAYDDNVFQAVKAPEYKSLIADGAVLIGDFNTFAKSGNDDYKRLCDNLPGFRDVITKSGKPAATYHHGGGNFGADDFCFVSDSFAGKIVNAKVDNSWDKTQDKCCWHGGLSDHCPIIVELELRG